MTILSEDAKQFIRELVNENGEITPQDLVEAARDDNTPIHGLFNWDDESAANEQRLNTARTILRRVTFARTTRSITLKVPAYIRNPNALARVQSYKLIEKIEQRSEEAREVLAMELKRIMGAIDRGRAIAGVLDLGDYFDEMLEMAQTVERILDGTPPPKGRGGGKTGKSGKGKPKH
jgi:hypothetical protein